MDASKIIGVTDSGQLVVTPQHSCENWRCTAAPMLNQKTCWYCKFADFRKTADMELCQSICRCPENRVKVMNSTKNESFEHTGGRDK